ncbi:MAG: hypothetical protein OXG56_09155, partial [Gammaproteobacteria bacterium]|nr:hypothetical protein [Gammaproteobacteria bacterium]
NTHGHHANRLLNNPGSCPYYFFEKTFSQGFPQTKLANGSAVMRKVQDVTKKRLHSHAKAGRIHGFVYVSLGQSDMRVSLKPANWVDRDDVIHYPTGFSRMLDDDIRRLSNRGEAITRALVTQYLLSD